MFFNKLRISGKVGIVITMFVLLCGGMTAVSILTVGQISKEMNSRQGEGILAARVVIFARQNLMEVQQGVLTALIGEIGQTPEAIGKLQADNDTLGSKIEKVRTTTEREYGSLSSDTIDAASAYHRFVADYIGLLRAGKLDAARTLLVVSGKPAYERAAKAYNDLMLPMGPAQIAASAKAAAKAAELLWMMIVISGIASLATAAGAFLGFHRGISRPLGRITGAMNRLAGGDLDVVVDVRPRGDEVGDLARAFASFRQAAIDKRATEAEAAEQRRLAEEQQREHDAMRAAIAGDQARVVNALAGGLSQLASGDLIFRLDTPFPPSYEKLRQDFNEAMDRLQDAMTTISNSALGISAGADEISRSATDLSQRTEQQAASLEETAAALDQITTAVRRTADGASEVKEAVSTATADAAASAQVVRDTIAAITEIQQSSRQVSQIIGVIDEIAFQTNLLALNAGVEAARAGEAGRGFAVVATEVRALAQRSATAAKEIKALISTSGDQVDTGVQLVAQTGAVLERIHASVDQIHDLISGIAASASEQATGLDEVNSAVDQMDRITQQNAALVEESTAASLALASESQQLTTLIGRFGIGLDQRAPAQPARPERRGPAPVFRRASGGAARKLEPEDADSWQEF